MTKQYDRNKKLIPAGPWNGEPDREYWVDPETGFPCLATRGPMGAWCGYAAVPEGHPGFGVHYDRIATEDGDYIDVHGGLTYSGDDNAYIGRREDEKDTKQIHWFGFDCSHGGDLAPALYDLMRGHKKHLETYRTLEYVKAQVTTLAQQLATAKPGEK